MSLSFPQELIELPQWACAAWPSKAPINVRTNRAASSTDPSTWATFEEALAYAQRANAQGTPNVFVGFMLSEADPFSVVDFDTYKVDKEVQDWHQAVVADTTSYLETSTSGKGLHLFVQSKSFDGVKHDPLGIELYSKERFIIVTGNRVNEHPIAPGQLIIDRLLQLIGQERVKAVDNLTTEEQQFDDEALFDNILVAANGDKFARLWNGSIAEHGNDHSSADMALLTFLDFHSQNVEQCIRMFKASKLYRPEKGRSNSDGTDYIERTLKAARAHNDKDRELKQIALNDMADNGAALMRQFEKEKSSRYRIENNIEPNTEPDIDDSDEQEDTKEHTRFMEPPPGMAGDIAKFIYNTSMRPIPEAGIIGALTLLSGIAGRQYNTTTYSGLNLYTLFVAETGRGKDGVDTGVTRLVHAIRDSVPAIDEFIGPGNFASGQGLLRALAEKKGMVSMIGECGHRFKEMMSPRASMSEHALQRILLDVFNRSGKGKSLSPTAHSDTAKNVPHIQSPALTLYGDTTPKGIFSWISDENIDSGLISRFVIFEYRGKRMPQNTAMITEPDPVLKQKLSELASACLRMKQDESTCLVNETPEAHMILEDYNVFADDKINESTDMYSELWNRAQLNALKIASLLAVGDNMYNPLVQPEHARWAVKFVTHCIDNVIDRVQDSSMRDDEGSFMPSLKAVLYGYLKMPPEERRKTYHISKAVMEHGGLIPMRYFQQRLPSYSAFRKHKLGANHAIRMVLQNACDTGLLVRHEKGTVDKRIKGIVYSVGKED